MVWVSLRKFCDTHFPSMKFKNDSQRKAHLLKRGIKIQPDESGVDGVAVPKDGPDAEQKEIRVGKRLSATKIKQMNFGGEDYDRQELLAQQAKHSKGLGVECNSKDS